LYRYTKEKGLIPILFTNGALVTEEIATLLEHYPPFSTEITLYGASEKTYASVTGNGHNFNKVIRGIERLKSHGVQVRLKSILLRQNVHDLDRIRDLAASYGSDLTYDPIINQSVKGDLPLTDLRLPPNDIVHLDHLDERRASEFRRLYRDFAISKSQREALYYCNAGNGNFHIDPQGRLSACIMVREPYFDLRQGSFLDGWTNLISKTKEQKRTRASDCAACKFQILCNQCPGAALLEKRDKEERIGYFCDIAKLRHKHLITDM
jgi:radical SAM protein with 4Fe4S-binding SPASM domain